MFATQLPFGGGEDTPEERAALTAKVCSGEWDEPPTWSDPARYPSAFELARGMLTVDPDERHNLDDVCADAWVGGAEAVPWRGTDESMALERTQHEDAAEG